MKIEFIFEEKEIKFADWTPPFLKSEIQRWALENETKKSKTEAWDALKFPLPKIKQSRIKMKLWKGQYGILVMIWQVLS